MQYCLSICTPVISPKQFLFRLTGVKSFAAVARKQLRESFVRSLALDLVCVKLCIAVFRTVLPFLWQRRGRFPRMARRRRAWPILKDLVKDFNDLVVFDDVLVLAGKFKIFLFRMPSLMPIYMYLNYLVNIRKVHRFHQFFQLRYGSGFFLTKRIAQFGGFPSFTSLKECLCDDLPPTFSQFFLRHEFSAFFDFEYSNFSSSRLQSLISVNCYRGYRLRHKLPSHGQRTRSNGRSARARKIIKQLSQPFSNRS